MEDNIPAAAAAAGVPSGGIIVWPGSIATIPSGYVICDGNNLTPNFTDKFVAHADADAAGTKNVGDTGGENTHVLSEAELFPHTHTCAEAHISTSVRTEAAATKTAGASTSGSTGSGTAHENRPPYAAYAFVMKT